MHRCYTTIHRKSRISISFRAVLLATIEVIAFDLPGGEENLV
jgi:hypothetical protein